MLLSICLLAVWECGILSWSFLLQLKADFILLLKETSEIDRHSRWSDIKRKIDSDSRYKAVDSSSRREDWFKDYVRNLEDVSSSRDSHSYCIVTF